MLTVISSNAFAVGLRMMLLI